MMYLIVGRTGSGKDYFTQLLVNRGLKQVLSYTTRPSRSEADEKTHIFIKPEEAENYPDRVAYTKINDYEYFATREQVENADVYIIDPNGVNELIANMPDTIFHIIYITADDDMNRKTHAVKRADDKIKEEQIFESRNNSEDEQFTAFEERIKGDKLEDQFPKNVMRIDTFVNNYDPDNAKKFADVCVLSLNLLKRVTNMLDKCKDIDLPRRDPNDLTKIAVPTDDGKYVSIPAEYYADIILNTEIENDVPMGLYNFLLQYVLKNPDFE